MLEKIVLAARGQCLKGNFIKVASDIINLIPCEFTFDEDWQHYKNVWAVFTNDAYCTSRQVLIRNGRCLVPPEVLVDKGNVIVNIHAGKISKHGIIEERLPSYETKIICIEQKVNVSAENSFPPTPPVWEQVVAKIYEELGEKIGDAPRDGSDYFRRNGEWKKKPYVSLERLRSYAFKVTFDKIPEYIPTNNVILSSCSSYVKDGKLYRNLDWNYDNAISFLIKTKHFTGISFNSNLVENGLDDDLIGQLPYSINDGVNENGIMVSTHVLFNDFDWHGDGGTPLTKIPYIILSSIKNMSELDSIDLTDLSSAGFNEYLLQFLVTDGASTFVITPSENGYELVNAAANPKLANFKWVNKQTVEREELQERPTGVERWNMMPCELEQLAFTKAYREPTRLSEFIGINGTTKDSSDEELEELYVIARNKFLNRNRNGETWQTMHSVIYSPQGMEALYVQEDWEKNLISNNKGGASNWSEIQNKPFSSIGENLKVEGGVLKVDTTSTVEADNTKPVTSAGVQVVVGNIDTLLQTI